ncbi:MAG: hypothetical protein EOM91_14385 [Sphingobacteriia bacterium]|nr:hypothetical protein [Sphingobacteriia bacterium]NCC40605.1 hypothetical protein [Gammaproteobacteria bacterium]
MKVKTLNIGLIIAVGTTLSALTVADAISQVNHQAACFKTEITQVKDATCEAGPSIDDGACAFEVMASCLGRIERVLVGNGNNGTLSEAIIELDLDDPDHPELNVDLIPAYVDCSQNEIAYCIDGNQVYPKPKGGECAAGDIEYYVPGTEDRLVKLQANVGGPSRPHYIDLDEQLVTFQCRGK